MAIKQPYIEHSFDDQSPCDYCGEPVDKVEHESRCAELTPAGKIVCWTCQNHNLQAQSDLFE